MKKKTSEKYLRRQKSVSTSSSLVARAGQIMAIVISFSLLSMISSMLVSESLSGDAAQINHAGTLRLQAMKISRAYLIKNSTQLSDEIAVFETKLQHLFAGGLTSARENKEIEIQYQVVLKKWSALKKTEDPLNQLPFDQFVLDIDKLVTLLQLESEKKLSLLRLIQGIGLLSILIISFVVLFRLNRTLVTPLKQLVEVAAEAGKGNFELKAKYDGDNELGVLAQTINQMSDELKSTYQDFEQRVSQKTRELTRTNQSLEILYHAANNLASIEHQQSEKQIIQDLESILGFGKVSIERESSRGSKMKINIANLDTNSEQLCLERRQFPLEKKTEIFGYLVWQFPKIEQSSDWQTQLLKAMADILATAVELEQKRNTENRLLIVEERAVIARELHDSLAQSLSYLKVQMSLLTRKMQKDVPKEQISETIEDIKQGLNSAYQQLRELLTTFRLKLEDPSIENALQGTTTEFSAKCQHPVKLDFQIPSNLLSANQEIHVLQIVREALSNIHRHANASNAEVSVLNIANKVKVQIWDDGVGLPTKMGQQGHFGLGIMEERAKSLNALIDIQSQQNEGTCVTVEFKY